MVYDEGDNEPEYGQEDDEEEQPDDDLKSDIDESSDEEEEQDNSEFKEINTSEIDLDLVFFFAAAVKTPLTQDQIKAHWQEYWIWTKKSVPLR